MTLDIKFPTALHSVTIELFSDEYVQFKFATENGVVWQIVHIYSFTPQSIDHLLPEQLRFITDVVDIIRTHGPRIVIDYYCRLASVPLPIAPEGYSFRAIGLNSFLLINDEAGISVATIEVGDPFSPVSEQTWVCIPELFEEGLDEELLEVFLCVLKSFNANEKHHDQ